MAPSMPSNGSPVPGSSNPSWARPGQYAFAHTLYRDARYDAITAGRRLRLHAAVTSALLPRAL